MSSYVIEVPGYTAVDNLRPTSYYTVAGEGYFRTFGIPLLAGRDFTAEDRKSDAVIVNQLFANRFFADDALGKSFSYGNRQVRVVGVVGDSKFRNIREEPQTIFYIPGAPNQLGFLQVRTDGNPAAAIGRLGSLLESVAPGLRSLGEPTTMEMQIDEVLARERLMAFLSALLGAFALVLSSIGLYGVLALNVVQRTREIGIRMAVGETDLGIAWLFLKESWATLLAGLLLGFPVALASGRLAETLLFGLDAEDPLTVAGSVGLLVLVTTLAALIPALRASRIDPMVALRHE